MPELVILATGLDGILKWINLYVLVANLIALWWFALFAIWMYTANAIWLGDEQAQKNRSNKVKSALKYTILSLIIADVVFGGIKLLWLDDAADSSNSTISEFFEKWADSIDSWNYKMKIGDDSNSDYKNSNGWDALNFWE